MNGEELIPSERLTELEGILGYSFSDKGLLVRALTHQSFINEEKKGLESNEKLEFLGDSVLSLVITDILLEELKDKREGDLTLIRSFLVNKTVLSRLSKRLGLGRFLLLGRGEEKSGGRGKKSILANLFEALVGAIYLDSRNSIEILKTLLHTYYIDELNFVKRNTLRSELDVKSAFVELVTKKNGVTPEFRVVKESGPEHDKIFEVEVWVKGRRLGKGSGRSKKEAEFCASRNALKRFQ